MYTGYRAEQFESRPCHPYLNHNVAAPHKLNADEFPFRLSDLAMCGQIARLSVVSDDALQTPAREGPSGMMMSVTLITTVVRLIDNAPSCRLLHPHHRAVEEHPRRRRRHRRRVVVVVVVEDVLAPVRPPVSTRRRIFTAAVRIQEAREVAAGELARQWRNPHHHHHQQQ